MPITAAFAFVSTREGSPSIYLADHEGSTPRRLVEGINPDWSIDDRIAFEHGGGDGRAAGIYVISASGGDERFIATGQNPSWSPDGRFLAVTRNDGAGYHDALWILDVDGANDPRQILPLVFTNVTLRGYQLWTGQALDPAWAPDGRSVSFSGCSGLGHPWDWGQTCGRLWMVVVEGDHTETELTNQGQATSPAWSADGRLAFTLDDRVYVRSRSGDWSVQSTGRDPDWTPDGRLVFSTRLPGASGLRLVVLEGDRPRPILPEAVGGSAYADSQVTVRPR